ncbi:FecR domain-containing protein [Chitinophaga varians]|uniref:FecR domain-containing protein n=1 Tax=Chitinophaga varians TaxID=2202339 RepID=UPI00165EEB7D|nr:FecR domain-containing protein [Chitinophaga varians]MBC9914904.1 FecR domain-containing protein [Chitinophaga varians]
MDQHHDTFDYAALILRCLRGEATSAEQQQLQTWLAADPRHEALYRSLQDPEQLAAGIAFQETIDVQADWEAVQARVSPAPAVRKPIWIKLAAWTSAAAAVITGVVLLYPRPDKPTDTRIIADQSHTFHNDVLPGGNQAVLQLGNGKTVALGTQGGNTITEADGTTIRRGDGSLVYADAGDSTTAGLYNTLTTNRAGQYQLTLEDGTRVWLNAASSLTFPVHFTGAERKVTLTGEGYFEVAANAHQPFKVAVNGVDVLVLGTQFNIGAYDHTVKTTLVSGAVKVQLPGKRSWQLTPGQQANVAHEQVSITYADTEKAIAWKEGIFYFKDDDFRDIMEQVARWYDLELEFKGPLPARKISGNISRQARLSQVLEMLNYVSGAHFDIQGRKVSVGL